jgi:Ni,Fe-hydrogenase I large subunit
MDQKLAQVADGGFYPLPAIDAQAMCQRLSQDDVDRFIIAPDWKGAVYETSPLTRMVSHPLLQQLRQRYGFGLLTRLVARLLELASIPAKLQQQLQALIQDRCDVERMPFGLEAGEGLGQVEAARGRLMHRAVVYRGVIAGYQILAPTEWNFHPQGMVARGLMSLPAQEIDTLKQYVDLFITAIDPCVGYRLEIL